MKRLWVSVLAFFGLAIVCGAPLMAKNGLNFLTTPTCEGRPEFITEARADIIGGFEKLPPVLLVASDAEYYVEAKENGQDVKVHSYQSFTDPNAKQSKVICGTLSKTPRHDRFSLSAPTLIDTMPSKPIGQSLWQFQVLSAPEGFEVHNQRSLAFVKEQTLERNLEGFGGNYKIYQLSPKQYEIVVSKTTHSTSQFLSVKFDAVQSL
jgi:hypothetical protein